MPDPTRKFLDDLHKQLNTLEKRLRYLETFETGGTRLFMVHNADYIITNKSLASGASHTTGDIRGTNGVSANAEGIIVMVRCQHPAAAVGQLYIDSYQAPDVYSPRLDAETGSSRSAGMFFVRLNDAGELTVTSNGGIHSAIYAWVIGYWI